MPKQTPVLTLQAAEIDKQIIFTQGSNQPNFTGATVKAVITNPAGVKSSVTCSIDNQNRPVLTTTGNEFPSAGTYSVQLEYDNNGPEKYYSPVVAFLIVANL